MLFMLNGVEKSLEVVTDLVHPADTGLSERSEPPQRSLARVHVSRGTTSSSHQWTGCSLRFPWPDDT